MANPIAVPGTVVTSGSLINPSGAQGIQGIQGIQGTPGSAGGYTATQSISLVSNNFTLLNDAAAPLNGQFYGYSGGVKGWFTPPSATGTTYTGSQSVLLTGSNFTLTGDTATPANGQFYGYTGGARGWFTPPGTVYTASNSVLLTGTNFTLTGDVATPSNGQCYGYRNAARGFFRPGFYNILDFGADPSGAADCTTIIQNLLNALTAGGTIYFPAGTYKVSAALTFAYPVTIIGDGMYESKISTTSASAPIFVFNHGTTGRNIIGLSFQASVARTASNAFILDQSNGFTVIERCFFSLPYIGIQLYQSPWNISYPQMIRIRDCLFLGNSSCLAGIYVSYAVDLDIDSCFFLPSGTFPSNGIYIDAVGDMKVSKCEIVNCGVGIYLANTSSSLYHIEDTRIDHCVIDGCTTNPIQLYAARSGTGGDIRSVMIDGCWMTSTSNGYGVRASTSGGGIISMLQINDNQIFECGGGIELDDAGINGVVISGNYIAGSTNSGTSNGIYLGPGAAGLTITGNRVGNSALYGGFTYGIQINANTYTLIVGNAFYGNTSAAQAGSVGGASLNTNNI